MTPMLAKNNFWEKNLDFPRPTENLSVNVFWTPCDLMGTQKSATEKKLVEKNLTCRIADIDMPTPPLRGGWHTDVIYERSLSYFPYFL